MDNDSPASRVGRTLWTVWYYLTEAVSRFFRPEPTNIIRNDPSSFQEPAGDTGPTNGDHTDSDASGREVDEEHLLATISVLNLSRPVVAWAQCTTDIDVEPGEEHMHCKTQLSGGSESKASDEGEGMAEVIAEDAKEEKRVQKLTTRGQEETQENDEYEEPVDTRSQRLTGDAMSKSRGNVGAEEESESAVTLDKTMTKTSVVNDRDKKHHMDKTELKAEDSEVELCKKKALSLEEEDNMQREAKRVQRDKADTLLTCEEMGDIDGVLTLVSDNVNKSDEGGRRAENQLCKELEDNDRDFKIPRSFTSLHVVSQIVYNESGNVSEDELEAKDEEGEEKEVEKEQAAFTEEEKVNKLKDDIQTVPEETRHIATGHVTCSEDLVQNAKTEMHTVEFTDGEQGDVTNYPEVQTIKRDDVETEGNDEVIDGISDMTITDITVDKRIFDKDQVEEERLSSETGDKEGYMEVAGTTTSVTVKYEGETGQETSGEFKNIPRGTCEGLLVVSQEVNSPLCEEAQGGVPEYNNKPGLYENQTQRYLENSKEIQTEQLPEEVESKEPESLQDSGCSTGADCLVVGERMEHEQESTDEIKNSFDSVVEEQAGILCLADAGLPRETETPLVEAAIQELSVDSVKTGIDYSEKELEMHVGLAHQSDETAKELQDGTEEVLVEFEIDEGLCDFEETDAAVDEHETTTAVAAEEVVGFAEENFRFLAAEVPKMTETGFFVESVYDLNLGQDSHKTPNLQESEFIKQSAEIEPKLFEDSSVEIEDAGNRIEEEAAKDELWNKNEREILMKAELPSESGAKEKTLIAECEAQNQLSDEALEISGEETEAESRPKDMSVISAEKMAKLVTESEGIYVEQTVSPSRLLQDVIDEEVSDLWIQTELSKDTSGIKQHEGSGKQMDRKIEPLNEGQDEILSVPSEKNKEQLMESESRFWDQSLCELGTQNSETQLMESASTGSFQGIYDMLVDISESADISKLSVQQPELESHNILVQEVAETEQSYQKEKESITETRIQTNSEVTSSETGHLNQELHESQEKTDEETGLKTEIDDEVTDLALTTSWKVTEEAEVDLMTERSTLFRVEETKAEDEPLEMTLSDSADEIEHTELVQSRSGSEASLEKGSVSPESEPQDETCSESEVAEHLTTESADQMEVDASVLDFTVQKSRIAVKNPRVRPPKDPRSLLHMPSLDPMPSSHLPVKIPVSVPLGGLGIGIKLPGLGAGFPVLKKTQCQKPETKPEEKSDIPEQDETQHKPKWVPPRHPGLGNPLLSELKTKLKKTTKDDES